jgi:hypothetical protein
MGRFSPACGPLVMLRLLLEFEARCPVNTPLNSLTSLRDTSSGGSTVAPPSSITINCGAVREILRPLGTSATIWPIVPAPDNNDDGCGAVGGMSGRGNRSTRRKPAPVPLCPPQIPHELNLARTRATKVGSQRLSGRAVTRPNAPVQSI